MNSHESTPVFSAVRIAEILTEPGKPVLSPTGEQQAVIEHPLSGSALVIAGAGSGKTETMANRVVWLIANGIAEPETILGLTFTRKAAGELRERIVGSLNRFVDRLTDLGETGGLSETEYERAAALREQLADGLDLPEVNTYNSFAAGVLQEFGVSAGIAPGATVIDEATAWRVAREVLLSSEDPELIDSDLSISALIRHLINMERAVADHQTSLERVNQVVEEFSRVTTLPYNDKEDPAKPSGKLYAKVRDAVAAVSETPLITRLARAYAEEKENRGLIDFSDQLSLAARAIQDAPEALSVLRGRFRAVLLDEVQDTSVGQTRFLSQIFAGMPVMAVGDPHQSIYAWRGASAEGLLSFHHDFAARNNGSSHGSSAEATLTLSVSWRNPTTVLAAANAISAQLRAESSIEVPTLLERPGAGTGRIDSLFPETLHEEREGLASWMAQARTEFMQDRGEQPTAAVILRKRSLMPSFSEALTAAGVPNRIVGLGGLLSTPEVTDIVSVLRCIWYADAGTDLLRVLAGPRFRLGVADLAGLRDAAKWFAGRDITQQPFDPADLAADSVLPDPDRQFTLIDALDAIASMKDLNHRALTGVSEMGRSHLREAGMMLRGLRRSIGGSISDLISAVVYALRLDIELESNEARTADGAALALANIEAFTDLAEGFLAIDTHGTLQSLLEWIERAREDDEVAEHVPAPSPGTVQLITVHGSKGLQWDIVAVPRLVEGEFPGSARVGAGWLRTGELPDELRGDRGARPELRWRLASTQKELSDRIDSYRAELRDAHASEERRLAYVAVTRAKELLLLTGSFWGGQKKARKPSPFLRELESAAMPDGSRAKLVTLPEDTVFTEDPSETAELTATWPLDPLGRRAETVFRAAELVREEIEAQSVDPEAARAAVEETVGLLLDERDAQTNSESSADSHDLPDRVTASTFHEFVEDPVAAERGRQRPLPQRPYRRTRVGNQFHEWVERRATTAAGSAITLFSADPEDWHDSGGDRGDNFITESAHEPELQTLIAAFERSRWADLQPVAVELEVTLPFAGRTLVCKLDAVYRRTTGGEERYEVVDWKTGGAPANDAERERRLFQLDLYRHAYAQWAGVAPDRIDVTLFYVAESIEVRSSQVRELSELEHIWQEAADRITGESEESGDRRPKSVA